eukprot:Phypoly_transcript_04155.p1 GENE.Phypoly_transcript_04155~~Phypoly_transcript_04155.p1  ORF type:complete len:702 (+),score=85.80 Phypoly_transcript_04155:122-2227(+)
MPSIPTNFNDTAGLEHFAKDLGIKAGVGFLIPALVLSIVLVFVFVKLCGGSGKTRVKFSGGSRFALLIASAIVCLICVATCAVGWSYKKKKKKKKTHGTQTLQGVLDGSAQLMLDVNGTVDHLKDQLFSEIQNKSAPVVSNITSLLAPLTGMLGVILQAGNTLDNLTTITNQLVTNVTAVKASLAALDTISGEGVINGVPNPSEIPNIDSSYTNALNSSQTSLDAIIHHVHNMTNEVNDTMNAVNTTVTAKLSQLTNQYNQNAEDVLSYVGDFETQIKSTNHSFVHISSEIRHYSSVRKSVMAAILVLPLVLSALALVGAVFRLKLIIKISAALCFIFMFWYFLAAGINFIAYYTIDQVCDNRDAIVGNAISITNEEISIPGTNITVKVSEKIELLLQCAGNETLIEIFEFNFLIDDLTGQIANEVENLAQETNQLNQTNEYHESLDSLVAMENTSVNLDFLQNSNLTTVHQELTNLTNQVNATINNPTYFSSLQAVNNITNNLMLNNGTEIHMYYNSSNITMLNCTLDPYSKLDSSQQEDLCNKSGIAITLTLFRDKTIAVSGSVYGNVTDIDNRLDGFQASLPQIYSFQNDTHAYATQIKAYLDNTYYDAAAIILYVRAAAAQIIALIQSGTGDIVAATQCAYVGTAYQDLSNNVCQDVRYSLKVITAMMIIGACMLFISTVVGMITSYKIARNYPNQD